MRRRMVEERWSEVAKKPDETWAAFKVKWDTLVMYLSHEGIKKDSATKFHRLLSAVNVGDGSGYET